MDILDKKFYLVLSYLDVRYGKRKTLDVEIRKMYDPRDFSLVNRIVLSINNQEVCVTDEKFTSIRFSKYLTGTLMGLFSMSDVVTEHLLQKWFDKSLRQHALVALSS